MATIQIEITIDEKTKNEAEVILERLGFDLSTAINMFLEQVVLCEGIPFDISASELKSEVFEVREIDKVQ